MATAAREPHVPVAAVAPPGVLAAHRCACIAGYLKVAIAYDLPITAGDHYAAAATAATC